MYLAIIVTIMCCNDELSWWFTKRFNAFYLSCRKQPNPSQNFCYSHSLNFHLSGSTLSVSKIPTQLIVQLNSSLRHIIVTLVTKFYNFDHNRKYFANVFLNDPDLDQSFKTSGETRLLINFLFSECCKTQFIPSQMFYES